MASSRRTDTFAPCSRSVDKYFYLFSKIFVCTTFQENKELRAALEEHQNALELIMSKYRHHVTRLVTTSKLDIKGQVDNEKLYLLAEKTEKVCEMAAVMKEAVKADEENSNLQQETMARLVTENKVTAEEY